MTTTNELPEDIDDPDAEYDTELDFEPYGNYLWVQPEAQESKVGSIYIPDQAQDKPCVCTVLRVGLGQRYQPDCPEVPCYSEEGDKVMVAPHGVHPHKIAGVTYFIVAEGDVYGRFVERRIKREPTTV